jgi:WD40 repeat protein
MFYVLISAHFISATVCDLCSLQVWDRRCLSAGQAAGVLTGHLHGVTHIDSRGDGRSFISNGKDQAIKLWDIRKMMSNADRYSHQIEIQVHLAIPNLLNLYTT